MPVELGESGAPHPRDASALVGHRAAAASLLEADRGGRLHHAWLLTGPQGIGKATLAYRFARYLLAAPGERLGGHDGLAVDMAGRTARQISAGSHPNLVAIERRAGPDGKVPRTLSVDAVRKALAFFGATAADGGRRICIIDASDDLTVAAANGLLKAIEEPPPGGLILIVSHGRLPVLPTVRSRCRLLTLAGLAEAEVAGILADIAGEADPALIQAATREADGSVSRALALLDPKLISVLGEVRGLLDILPKPSPAKVLALSETLADRRAEASFPVAMEAVFRWLGDRVEGAEARGVRRLAPLVEVCEKIAEEARDVETYNLDRRLFVLSLFDDLAEAVRRAA